MSVKIYGLCGAKNHGKDTAAKVGLPAAHRFAFADALKQSAAAAFGLPLEHFHHPELKEQPIPGFPEWTYRSVLEHMGTEWFRVTFPGIWVQNVLRQCENAATNGVTEFVVTDVRFVDEANALGRLAYTLGGICYIVEVVAPHKSQVPDPIVCQELGLHPSQWNYKLILDRNVIFNDGTLDDLRDKVTNAKDGWRPYGQ